MKRKARKGKSQPGNDGRAENKGESDESEKINVLMVCDSKLQRKSYCFYVAPLP